MDNLVEAAAENGLEHQFHGEKLDESDGDDSLNFAYMVAEPFLFETDPISCLQANVKAFVKLPQSKRLTDTLGDSIKLCFENMVQKLGRLPIMEGKKRITWTCVRIFCPLTSRLNVP